MSYNKDISLVNPTDLVNDQNANAAPKELQENIEYILNFLNGNKALLAGVYGNLWDYNGQGQRVLANGGKFDSFKKCNSWDALDELRQANETEIIFDEDAERCVYIGQSNLTTDREKWIEREVWVPEVLRDQQLLFALKASGCTESTGWTEDNAVFETIAIQILGAEEDVQEFRTVGTWSGHDYYANESYDPNMTTVYVPFRVSKNTTSIKIKILRTVATNYLHIDRLFVGGLATPYDNEIEEYEIDRLDINEFYDFENGVTKVVSTAVLGHKVPDQFANYRGSDLVTFEMLNQFLQTWVTMSATCNLMNIQGVYSVAPNATSNLYTISHENISGEDVPVVTLVAPATENDEPTILDREWVLVATGTHGLTGTTIDYTEDTCYSLDDIMKSVVDDECDNEDHPSLITIRSELLMGLSPLACTSGSSGTSGTSGTSACPFDYFEFETGFYKDIVDQTTKKAIKIIGITGLTDGQFDVILSEPPTSIGYSINWSVDTKILCNSPGTTGTTGVGTTGTTGTPIGNYFHPSVALSNLFVPDNEIPDPTGFADIFGFGS